MHALCNLLVYNTAQALRKRLLARKHFIPWGASKPFVHPALPATAQQQQPASQPLQPALAAPQPAVEPLPPGIEPLILWEPPTAEAAGSDVEKAVEVGKSG